MLRARTLAVLIVAAACRPAPASEPPADETNAPSPGAIVDAAPQEPAPDAAQPPDDTSSRATQFDVPPQDTPPPLPALPKVVAAEVGAVKIPAADFRTIYDLKVAKYTARGREIPRSADVRYRKSIIERLIYHEVLRQEAEHLRVTDDAAKLAEREAQQRRGITDWAAHLERRGETETSLREMYIAELREHAILDKLGKLEVTRAEIEADYAKIEGNWHSDRRRVRASHILAPDEAQARKLYELATKKGADFAAIAREHSTGPSAIKGGDIGIFTPERMVEEFSAAAFAMKVGQISKPVKTKFGYHIIKVTGRWPPGALPLSALEDQIVERLEQRKLHEGRRVLKADLLGRYHVVDHVAPALGP